MPLKAPLDIAHLQNIAIEAGHIMREHFMHFGMERTLKADESPVTAVDIAINRLVIESIHRIAPEVDIVGEEESSRTDGPWRILCDPIDGTYPFTWGMPIAVFMICLLYEGAPVMGLIHDPFTGRMYHAEKGKGAWLNGSIPLRVADLSLRRDSPIVGYASWQGCPYHLLEACQFMEEERGFSFANTWSIGYMDVTVATGEWAGTIFPGNACHDTAPGHIIVEEAGGVVTDIFGRRLDYSKGEVAGHIFACNHQMHRLLVEGVNAE